MRLISAFTCQLTTKWRDIFRAEKPAGRSFSLKPFGLVLASVLVVTTVTFVRTADAGKPRPSSPLPPARYQIQYWTAPNGSHGYVNDMNNLGQIVGWYRDAQDVRRAYLYTPSGSAQGSQLEAAQSIDSLVATPEGWTIASAVGINDYGVIVGYLEKTVDAVVYRSGYVLDTLAVPLTLESIPDGAWSYTWPRRINENGDILGVYWNSQGYVPYVYNHTIDTEVVDLGVETVADSAEFNNPIGGRGPQLSMQVVDGSSDGTPVRWTLDPLTHMPVQQEILVGQQTTLKGINDSGTICGRVYAKVGQSKAQFYAFRYSSAFEYLSSGSVGVGINNSGDVLLETKLYLDEWKLVNIDDLIDRNGDPIDATEWFNGQARYASKMNQRFGTTGLGQLAGSHTLSSGSVVNYLLIPIVAP